MDGHIPAFADYMTADNAQSLNILAPANSNLAWFFMRYLLQKAISVFRWRLPANWDKDYLLYCLYCFGRVAVINTDRFGVIPQACGLMGYNVFYRPTNAIITNPLLTGIIQPRIDVDCTIIKLQPDYGGLMDIIRYYANLLAQASEAVAVNLNNSKLALAFFAKNKAAGEAFKKAFDAISNGQPMVVIDKSLLADDGSPLWDTIQQHVKENYIVDDLLSDMRKITAQFDTDIGIPNANTDKRERLITDEVNANNVETYSKCALWLEQLQESCRKTRAMFGIDIDVDWREIPDTQGGGAENGTVSSETDA